MANKEQELTKQDIINRFKKQNRKIKKLENECELLTDAILELDKRNIKLSKTIVEMWEIMKEDKNNLSNTFKGIKDSLLKTADSLKK